MKGCGIIEHPTRFLHSDGPSLEKVFLVPLNCKTFPNGLHFKVQLDKTMDKNLIEWWIDFIKENANEFSLS